MESGKRLVVGIAAHVDAGKTTLAESLMFRSGMIRRAGRVDNKDAFLDTETVEKERGITVFSHIAVLKSGSDTYTLLDTPGHPDFSAETERAFSVLDYCILVISGTDGVQSHTLTLWKLLEKCSIPVFIFINKMDIAHDTPDDILRVLKKRLSDRITLIGGENGYEELALHSEDMMNEYLDTGSISDSSIADAVQSRTVFPAMCGSALRMTNIDDFLDMIGRYTVMKGYPAEFAAKVYKLSQDKNTLLTHVKITGGSLSVRDELPAGKVTGIRIYSGVKYTQTESVQAGCIAALTGLSGLAAGDGLGAEEHSSFELAGIMSWRVIPGEDIDTRTLLSRLRSFELSEPGLRVRARNGEVFVNVLGEMELEILNTLWKEKYGSALSFDEGSVTYRETIEGSAEGAGHYEPLRHYAEAAVRIEQAERGSGITVTSELPEDILPARYQHQILSVLREKEHLGVLTGSVLTDVRIILINGRAHIKHTEGGDFREAAVRAVRNALMYARNILLEPYMDMTLSVPEEFLGRVMSALSGEGIEFSTPDISDGEAVITGSAPAQKLARFHTSLSSLTSGKGRLSTSYKGYFKADAQDDIVRAFGYDPEADLENSPDSVFCSHGAGVIVKWDEVKERMHTSLSDNTAPAEEDDTGYEVRDFRERLYSDEELMAVFERTYGKIDRPRRYAMRREVNCENYKRKKPQPVTGDSYLLVDGYNVIFADAALSELARSSLDHARHRLTDILINYSGFRRLKTILVFDAYRMKNESREITQIGGITVVYTKKAETADMYIERVSHELAPNSRVRVVTSDYAEQLIILGNGALRVSAAEFFADAALADEQIRALLDKLSE